MSNQSGITPEGLIGEMGNLTKKTNKPSELLAKIMLTTEKIKKIKEGDIRFADTILRQNGNAIIWNWNIYSY